MSITYTKEETINKLAGIIKELDNLYKSELVNWKGKTSGTKEFYSEIIAERLLREIGKFEDIRDIKRKGTYCRENHCNIEMDICDSNRREEIFAKRITGLQLNGLGKIIDYQVPLKDTQKDQGVGKIDLISYNKEENKLYLIELKYEGNKDTLLKTSLEIYTYWKLVDKTKLKDDFKLRLIKEFKKEIEIDEKDIIPALLLTPKCRAYKELKEVKLGARPKLKALALALNIKYFTIEFLTNEIIL